MRQDIEQLNMTLTRQSAQDVLAWAQEEFGESVTLALSLGAEDVVLLDMLSKSGKPARAFVLDTGRLHQETYDLLGRVKARYRNVEISVYFPQTSQIEQLVSSNGPNSFYESVDNRRECCRIRKVEPLARALSGVDAWITGLRRVQSVTRAETPIVEADEAHGGILKVNPLTNWSEDDVWSYIRANGVPYHPLHDNGYPSIGCAPCTRAIEPGEDIRAGRWWWENPEHKECGLHIKR